MPILFPQEIRGLGTQDVESLPSYLYRCAHYHHVSVGKLLLFMVDNYRRKYPDRPVVKTLASNPGKIGVFARPNLVSRDLVSMLADFSGRPEVRATSFVPIMDSIVRSAGVYSAHMRWCPECMAEWESKGDDGYYKLLWLLNPITHCPSHKVKLEEKCPHCGSYQTGFGYRKMPRVCNECEGSLAASPDDSAMIQGSSMAVGADLVRLVEYISMNPLTEFPRDAIQGVIASEFDKAWNSGSEDEFWQIIPKNDCIGIAEGVTQVTLAKARTLAYRLGVELYDLLLGDVSQSPAILDPRWVLGLPNDLQPSKRVRSRDKDKVLAAVHALMKENRESPKPLKFYAESVGVSVGYLNYRFPVLCERIVGGFRAWLAEEALRKKELAYQVVRREFTSGNGVYNGRSRKSVLRAVMEQEKLPKRLVRQAVKDVYQWIGGENVSVGRFP